MRRILNHIRLLFTAVFSSKCRKNLGFTQVPSNSASYCKIAERRNIVFFRIRLFINTNLKVIQSIDFCENKLFSATLEK